MFSLVLSLERDLLRRKKFFQQKFANTFEVFTAIDAKSQLGKEYILKHFDFNLAKKLYKREITLGEAACTLSHLAMYRYFLQSSLEEYLIICEDDALFSNDFAFIEKIIQEQKGFDVVLFGESKVKNFNGNWKYKLIYPLQLFPQKIGKYKLGKLYYNYTAGTVGYVISRKLIETLLGVDSVYWLADDFQTIINKVKTEQKNFSVGYLFPKLVIENLDIISNLEDERVIEQKRNESIININILHKLITLFKAVVYYFPKKYIAYIRR
ncbi:hypothetical protein CEP48_02575 [Mergibacter septicus]|uniref:Glycosyl transferase family 25 domain-containing protein n=1 Tax=Mergibacter septicus TaxID=221402 RepID=A0A8E3MFB5_9PAST|nr:glycosyltransferase family 25 protein [Mergibacter septicus]AWX15114.1 hypothetical protein CEP47_02575 [Mergibacter septicus]QDJ12632.1 hypothetical protein CEP45_01715 [Mergibacter septicus]QDJ14367.1 hypothetical protein CEP48_02575 [Mergibacter septicus]UTU48193.1 glycosyltransferase family 25 protein [Mergibacter septicus]WMR96188.1 glycosyltransferase family 25 protein [Mergibacter septicus]